MKRQGFTLIELLVVVGILLLFVGGAVVNFVGFQEKQKVQQAAADLKTALRFAQSKAASGEKPGGCTTLRGYTVSFTTTSYIATATCEPEIPTTPIVTKTLPANVTFSPVPSSFVFFPLAAGASAEQIMVLSGTTVSFTVTVTKSGAISDAVVPTPTPTPPVAATNGLNGSYFDTVDFSQPVRYRTDDNINFDWGEGRPIGGIDVDSFSVEWVGYVETPGGSWTTGTFTFFVDSNDGAKLWVNNQLIIDRWTNGGAEASGLIVLAKKTKYPIKLQMYENKNKSWVKLKWQGPTLTKQIIKAKYLYVSL